MLFRSGLSDAHPELLEDLQQRLAEHHRYVREHGEDLPEVQNWKWPSATAPGAPDYAASSASVSIQMVVATSDSAIRLLNS